MIELNGNEGYVAGGAFDFKPPQTLAIWVKPGQLTNEWNMVATGGVWNRAWMLFLYYKQAPYSVDFRPWGKRMFVDAAVPQDKWSYLAIVNGEKMAEEASIGGNWALGDGPLVLGTWLNWEKPYRGLIGRLAGCSYWAKALDAPAIKALGQEGPK